MVWYLWYIVDQFKSGEFIIIRKEKKDYIVENCSGVFYPLLNNLISDLIV